MSGRRSLAAHGLVAACALGACVAEVTPAGVCGSDRDCDGDRVCVDGLCNTGDDDDDDDSDDVDGGAADGGPGDTSVDGGPGDPVDGGVDEGEGSDGGPPAQCVADLDCQALGTTKLGRPYAGVIAEADPTPFSSPCGVKKEKQTNAIVFATDRLQAAGDAMTWQSYRNVNGSCVLNSSSRARGIAITLRDLQSNELVGAASIHWSTVNGGGPDPACATANVRHTDLFLRADLGTAALFVFGGDTNEPDTVSHTTTAAFNPWYAETNVDLGGALGYLDPIARRCSTGSFRACLVDNWTFRGANTDKRIDFLFTRRSSSGLPGLLRAHTVTFNEANDADARLTGSSDSALGYSDHRAVLARLRY